jgi:hypothetical protein
MLIAADSDSMKRAKVTTTAVAARMTFNFDSSNVGKACIRAMHVSYFMKGHARLPGPESVPTPRAYKVVVFEDLFSVGLHIRC